MIIAIFNNFFVIVLTLVCVMKVSYPALFFIAAGLMMIFITAEEMDINMTAAKLAAAVCFSFTGGFFPAFLIFAVPDKQGPVKRSITGALFYLAYFVASVIYDGGGLSGREIAVFIIRLVFVFVMILLVSFAKQLLVNLKEKSEYDRQILVKTNIRELHEKQLNRELAMQNFLAEKNARLIERENISRNIHNSVGHSITAAIMTLDAADMLYEVKPDEARKKMNDANERIRGSLDSIRRAVRTLDEEGKPVSLGDLVSDFNGIIDEFVMDTKIKVDRIWKLGNPDEEQLDSMNIYIPHEHAEFLTGVLKEFLTNGLKHGNADYFIVTLTGDSAHLRLSVKDNGHSDFTDENSGAKIEKGFGIKKIQSYVERLGGKTEFRNDDGFRAAVELPLL
ncbi:MAG: hypothetical protein IJM14_07515 [Lachnospiraceae bacterium]|nr:hypothetical protein [Lachnospiraceae bacterium]